MTVAVFSNLQAAIEYMAQLKPGPGERLAKRINRRVQNLLAPCIAMESPWVTGRFSILGMDEADWHVNLA